MKKVITLLVAIGLFSSSALFYTLGVPIPQTTLLTPANSAGKRYVEEVPVIVSKDDPFYALIATPVTIYYENTDQHVAPLLVQDFDSPSRSVIRFLEMSGVRGALEIPFGNPVEVSLTLAELIWEQSEMALLVEWSPHGYQLGMAASALASYLNIPILVLDSLESAQDTLQALGVQQVFVCGNIEGYGKTIRFTSLGEIAIYLMNFVKQRFGSIDYITLSNPQDTIDPAVLNDVTYTYQDTLPSLPTLPAQSFNVLTNLLLGQDIIHIHDFEVPYDDYARINIDLVNLCPDDAHELGDRIYIMIMNATGTVYAYTATGAGIATYQGDDIVQDSVHYEFIVNNEPGIYRAQIIGQWFAATEGEYNLTITVEQLNTPLDPLMNNLSSLAGYLTAYHKGIVYSQGDWAFAYPGKGISQPSDNPQAIQACNNHVLRIHSQLNELLSAIAETPSDSRDLWEHYTANPLNIAILADPTMIPMYYYQNPDDGYLMGWGVPGDFVYGDIDPLPEDMENNSYSYYPQQENAVGRITGYDAEDCSALIARTIFYHDLLPELGSWKTNATIQTGCGLEFQWLPVLTTLSNTIYGGEEPTKWPTGESYFMNLRLSHDLEKNGFQVQRTHLLESQCQGFENLGQYGRKYFLFPRFYEAISGENVHGGQYQETSNIIFAFNHGFYYLYESGDILLDARGFPPFTTLSRFFFSGSGLSGKGTFDVRTVHNMDYGPSVVFIESCICGRTDGLQPENTLSQAYLHAGVNAFVAASRVTADPGYLEPGKIIEGFGIWGFINATWNLKQKGIYPQPHFGAVIAEDFILDMVQNDNSTGLALRNAKNEYLDKDANTTFLWTPPLVTSGCPLIDKMIQESFTAPYEPGQYLDKKYHCLHEFNLYGDPAFNPYQPGKS